MHNRKGFVVKIVLLMLTVAFTAASCDNQTTTGIDQPMQTQKKKPAQGKTESGCDPNYSGCVPIASDVDCAGGSGNGPAYVRGPINVIGSDIYGLDRDHNGIACE